MNGDKKRRLDISKDSLDAFRKVESAWIYDSTVTKEQVTANLKEVFKPYESQIVDLGDTLDTMVGMIVENLPRKIPYQVKVYAGDGQTFLGLGNYVGNETVYFYQDESGNLLSCSDATQVPADVPADKIQKTEGNPKIILDNGQVVYGCQVWWEAL
jgi:hypothetical protein